MITIRRSKERGHADHGWLKSYHTFSFANYYDEKFMGFRSLRVINEDWVDPGQGFGTHPHRDMEIITYVLEGELEHKDSLGTGAVIYPGEVQVMSAGTGVTHSEFNHSKKDLVHLLQIWIMPEKKGMTPEYAQKKFSVAEQKNQLHLVVSYKNSLKKYVKDPLFIHQDAHLYACRLDKDQQINQHFDAQRFGWLQMIEGELEVNSQMLKAGDAAAITQESDLLLKAKKDSHFLLFNLA